MRAFTHQRNGTLRSRATRLALAGLLGFGLACASSPDPMEMGEIPAAEELYADGLEKLSSGRRWFWLFDSTDYQGAINTFQDIIDNYPYSDYAVLAELSIADAYFEQELWEEAVSYYRDFAELHPDHPKVAYTLYRAAESYYHQSRRPGRDQTATLQAIDQLEIVLRRFPHSGEAQQAETMWRELRTRLGDHVMRIGNFYMKRSEFQSAADRYRSVLNEYPGLGLDAEALYKLGVCYERMHLNDEAARIFQVILENYSDTDLAQSAADFLPTEPVASAN